MRAILILCAQFLLLLPMLALVCLLLQACPRTLVKQGVREKSCDLYSKMPLCGCAGERLQPGRQPQPAPVRVL